MREKARGYQARETRHTEVQAQEQHSTDTAEGGGAGEEWRRDKGAVRHRRGPSLWSGSGVSESSRADGQGGTVRREKGARRTLGRCERGERRLQTDDTGR